ncbi:MAG: hypothetical protein J6Z17_03700 [Treponema sp.]|nr:hypothetical protein [Treponema sp.]
MSKGKNLPLFYLIGMAAVIVGSFLPIISVLGLKFTVLDAFGSLKTLRSVMALIMFVAAIVGVVFCFLGSKNGALIKTVALFASIICGVIFFAKAGFFDGWFDVVGIGFYVIVAGWIVAVIGFVTNK